MVILNQLRIHLIDDNMAHPLMDENQTNRKQVNFLSNMLSSQSFISPFRTIDRGKLINRLIWQYLHCCFTVTNVIEILCCCILKKKKIMNLTNKINNVFEQQARKLYHLFLLPQPKPLRHQDANNLKYKIKPWLLRYDEQFYLHNETQRTNLFQELGHIIYFVVDYKPQIIFFVVLLDLCMSIFLYIRHFDRISFLNKLILKLYFQFCTQVSCFDWIRQNQISQQQQQQKIREPKKIMMAQNNCY